MDKYRIKPGAKINLARINPDDRTMFKGEKAAAQKATAKLVDEIEALQELLWAEHKHKVLVVIQAMDTGGKDGVIRNVFDGVNPLGVRVASFKAPTSLELEHDYLWRIHAQAPSKGEMVMFNRSHYEDVLIVRVRNFAPEAVWRKRFDHINNFEQMLADEGTLIIKIFLNISKDEQKERLESRLADKSKHWKFNVADLKERERWDDYMAAYNEALARTSTAHAPWHVVPANRKWYRDYVVATIVRDALKGLNMNYPVNPDDLSKVVVK
jgi:PPK2 family polyphosphate:nucleotide phosphotransferase